MPKKGPHISIPEERLVPRVLGLSLEQFAQWPESVRELGVELAAELFLVRCNPFIDAALVRQSVGARLTRSLPTLSGDYPHMFREAVNTFWRGYDEDQFIKNEIVRRLEALLPPESMVHEPGSLIETSTDATDLRMELPLLMVSPQTTAEVQAIVRLAGEMGFFLVPRGGGTGLTGGAVPAMRRTVILSLSRMKTIYPVDTENKVLCAQAGVLTLNAIKAAEKAGLLFTVDPASKAGSSIGGNISENSGGPFAFEYGTTLDNILSFKQVMPDGNLVEVRRKDHPRHKIMPGETAVFEVLDESGGLLRTVTLGGNEIRGPGLGKDVSNKFLGGLPGVQKEGVDGVIVEGCFTLYDTLKLSRTLCLEFFGRSMHNAMLVIKDVVGLRDRIREEGDLVKISSLEEFNSKYVQAIGYQKKSSRYEGEPISVLLLQLDSDDAQALDAAVSSIVDLAEPYEGVDIFVARDAKEAEHFWEDRHKLSAIAKRTSGFKVNEDIVIPLEGVPVFSDFLEDLNLYYMAYAYRLALQEAGKLPGLDLKDKSLDQEMITSMKILRGQLSAKDMTEQELEIRAALFFQDLENRYPKLKERLAQVFHDMRATRIVLASHMHAGDGNCHVNIPVNSNDPQMLALAYEAAGKVFEKVLSMGGGVSGEHGIGITKIAFLQEEKMEALRRYKAVVDPKGIINPGKLVTREMAVEPYTFSFNRLIQDLAKTALPDKERLIKLLSDIQVCTRCGKCKQVCPMYYPEKGLLYHPRNKNMTIGALVEAVYYSQMHEGRPEQRLLDSLRRLTEHCTACGRCASCPVKINSADVTLFMRAFLDEKKAGGHPIKTNVLGWLAKEPEIRAPMAAKAAAVGQNLQNRMVGLIPARWRDRLANPLFSGKGPEVGFRNLAESLHLSRGSIFAPESLEDGRDVPEAVFYFPGCGASLFSRSIGLASLYLLIRSGVSVILPPKHLCCGYPLLSQGMEEAYLVNQDRNLPVIRSALREAKQLGFFANTVLTSCGTCRESLQKYGVEMIFGLNVRHLDVTQYLLGRLSLKGKATGQLLYHSACHAEWNGLAPAKSGEAYRKGLAELTGTKVHLSPGCCGESGLGAMTSPAIYNKLRGRKQAQLAQDLEGCADCQVVVGCPSCKMGISRCLLGMEGQAARREVLHAVEYLARLAGGPDWRTQLLKSLAKDPERRGLRIVRNLD
jgi:FAD/FMN-containing dehydrogenase/Fe-S oxidoreductase